MNYQTAKDTFEELKNFEGKATFQGEETKISFFVLVPQDEAGKITHDTLTSTYNANSSFEIEGSHSQPYTILGVNAEEGKIVNDPDYFMKLLVW